jgi:hypothetical protein
MGAGRGDRRPLLSPHWARRPSPVVPVLGAARQKKADDPICAPKGSAPPPVAYFACKATTSRGAEVGAVGADHGRLAAGGCLCGRAGGGGHAPVVAVLLAPAKKALARVCAPKGIGPAPTSHFPCKAARSGGCRSGAMGADHGPLQLPAARAGAGLAETVPRLWLY